MPRICFTARPINAPRDSRTGGRRTPRHDQEGEYVAPQSDVPAVGRPGRSTFTPGWWILPCLAYALILDAVIVWAIIERLF